MVPSLNDAPVATETVSLCVLVISDILTGGVIPGPSCNRDEQVLI